MPKRVSGIEFEVILDAVGRFPDGASIEDIAASLATRLPRRTLQRRLAQLTQQRRLIPSGRARGTRYRVPRVARATGVIVGGATLFGRGGIPLSAAGEAIQQAVRAPIQNRNPVGYNREFLDHYHPNATFYLSPETRESLLEMGRSSEGQRPAGTHARQVYNRLLIDLSWNSSRLEGNTYSLLETERLLEIGEAAEGKQMTEAQMILNHKAAIELLVGHAAEVGFNRYTLCNLHALLSHNLLSDPLACGRLRQKSVGISGSTYLPPANPLLVRECFQQLLDTAAAIADPFEQAFFVMVQLPYLQPFDDVNKRVSRLAANLPFIRENLSPLSFVDVPESPYIDGYLGVYELNRIELLRDVFVWAYERSCARYAAIRQSLGEPDPFRLRHHQALAATITEIVTAGMDKKAAVAHIKQRAAEIMSPADGMHFIEIVETELMSLHEGNIARYRLRPSQYRTWMETWR